MPDDLAATPLLVLWEHNVFAFLLAEGRITEKVVEQIRSWKHSGNVDTPLRYVLQAGCLAGARLSVDKSVHVSAGDPAAMQRVVQYMVRCIHRAKAWRNSNQINKVRIIPWFCDEWYPASFTECWQDFWKS